MTKIPASGERPAVGHRHQQCCRTDMRSCTRQLDRRSAEPPIAANYVAVAKTTRSAATGSIPLSCTKLYAGKDLLLGISFVPAL